MQEYHNLLQDVMENGTDSDDRTGVGTRRVFGRQIRVPLDPFPILTTKAIHFRSIYFELMWMLLGRNDVQWLTDRKVSIWNEWQNEEGTIGPGYGVQWRNFGPEYDYLGQPYLEGQFIDQLSQLVLGLRDNPNGRRHIVNAWNANVIQDMTLPPCHIMFQVAIIDRKLSLHMYQRSADLFLGVPFNITQYALLSHILCWMTGYEPGELIISYGDLHVYRNHFDQVLEQLSRSTSLHERGSILKPHEIMALDLSHADWVNRGRVNLSPFNVSPHYNPAADMIPWYEGHHYPAIKAEVAI